MNLAELEAKTGDLAVAWESARQDRKSYARSIKPELEVSETFRSNLWKRLFPAWGQGSVVGFDLARVRAAYTTGEYARLDVLSAKIAPLVRERRRLKQIENAAETEYQRALREFQAAAKRAIRPTPQGKLVL